jgi:hypothetical protein
MIKECSIYLTYERGGLRNVGDSLKADPTDIGPGWFLRCTSSDGYVDHVKYVRVDPKLVTEVVGRLAYDQPYGEALKSTVHHVNMAHIDNEREARTRALNQIEDARALLARLDGDLPAST